MPTFHESGEIVILIPVYNDWKAAELLLHALDQELGRHQLQVKVMLVDDGSTEQAPADFWPAAKLPHEETPGAEGDAESSSLPEWSSFAKVEILELRRNLGHQRAIAIGLSYLQANEPCRAVLVMDGDGEDDPADVPRLIKAFHQHEGKKVVFARRSERSESLLFRVSYFFYRLLHMVLTGQRINVGNFSILPFEAVDRLVAVSELWNHYVSAVFKARLPHEAIDTKRARRLAAQPKMNFVALVIHGLSGISAYGDVVGVRMLLASCFVIIVALGLLITVVVIRLGTEMAIPGWATNAFGLLLIILFQAIISSVVFIFITLSTRQGAQFLPVRDHVYFVLRTRRLA